MTKIMQFFVGALLSGLTLLTSAAPLTGYRAAANTHTINSTLVEKRDSWPKRGLPFNDPPQWIKHFDGTGSQVNWAYSWASEMHKDFPSQYLEFVPMLWGTQKEKTDTWFKNADDALSRGSGHLLAFNEPDRDDQANLTPEQAADAYREYLQPYASRASLGAPAVTSQDGVGLPWLRRFLDVCHGCKIDFVPVHWYGSCSDDAHFTKFIKEAGEVAGGRKIWITEFAAFGSPQEQAEFLHKIMPWLDQQSYVERYAWFWTNPTWDKGTLTKPDGWPTDLGNTYTYTPFG